MIPITTGTGVITSGGTVITGPIVTLATVTGGQVVTQSNGVVVTLPPNVVVTTLPNGQVVTQTIGPVQTGVVPITASGGERVRAFSFGALEAFVAVLFALV